MQRNALVDQLATADAPPLSEAEQVFLAMHPRLAGPLLAASLARAGTETGRGSNCRVLDVKYEPGEYFTALYELDGDLVTGFLRWPDGASGEADLPGLVPGLGMRTFVFPDEPSLPMLKACLDPSTLLKALEALPEYGPGGARLLQCRVTPLRFRPGKRCTLRIDLWERPSQDEMTRRRVIFGKVYHKLDKARAVFLEMEKLYQAFAGGDSRLILARPVGILEDLIIVLQEGVSGTPLDEVLDCRAKTVGPRSVRGLEQAAAALSLVHHSGLTAGRTRSIAAELERFQLRGRKIQGVNGPLGGQVIAAAQRLSGWLEDLESWGAEAAVVHGDCKPSQVLVSDAGAAILDFDHVGMADPTVDVGTFLATLRQMAFFHPSGRRSLDEGYVQTAYVLEGIFLDAYCAAGPVHPDFRLRAAWYQAAGLVRKAIRAFERSPYSSLPAVLLAEAGHCMESLPQAAGSSLDKKGSVPA